MFSSKQVFIANLVEKWPSAIVAQHRVDDYTGGLIDGRTLSNLHSLDKSGAYTGPPLPPKKHIGRRAVYSTQDIAEYLWRRMQATAEPNPVGHKS